MKFKRLLITAATLSFITPSGAASDVETTVENMKKVADWQLENPRRPKGPLGWTEAPFYLGLFNLYQVSGDERYLNAVEGFGEKTDWAHAKRITHADDHAVLQAWLELAKLADKEKRMASSVNLFPKVLDKLKGKDGASITGGSFTWCWCDALYMSPPVWAQLSKMTGDSKYLEWADKEWWTTTDVLFDPTENLYYRDNKYFDHRSPKGSKIFWGRGNGWVVGGLTSMLDYLPEDHPSREKYLGLYGAMMDSLLKLQNDDGLWRMSLLDKDGEIGEASGSAFIVYGMAWGLNRGLLPEEKFRPAVEKGWAALEACIQPSGMIGFIQSIGEKPGAAGPKSTEVYGAGAFLQAGAEVVRMLDPKKRRDDLATFEGVELPESFMPYPPAVHARFVPERKDDFAWENDLIAFRAYGPALRDGDENGGFDAWLKRVPYPIVDKWYIEDAKKLPYGRVNKPYHNDHGEGSDTYKVGDSRGCGGISLWMDGKLQNLETYMAHRIIEESPEKAVFELDYVSKIDGKTVRETKRITVIMGERLFQCESKFTIDGKPAAVEVAIGLKPQSKAAVADYQKATGTMMLWETHEGLGLGTAIVTDPANVTDMIKHSDGQSLCIAKTDAAGYIRWYAGYGWEGQGVIKTQNDWSAYLKAFSESLGEKPFGKNRDAIKVHSAGMAGKSSRVGISEDFSSALEVKANGGWCWYQGPRAITLKSGELIFTTISGDTYGGFDAGDLWATSYNPKTGEVKNFELHDKFQRDDHNVAGLLELPDGRILAVYGKHGGDQLQRWRTTVRPGDITEWTKEETLGSGAAYTYSNVFRLSDEDGRIYNFSRSKGYNPNCAISEDDGKTWAYGWRLFKWSRSELTDDPSYTGIDGGRPYVRYASNNKDTIHFVTSEDHPRAYDNSIYHGYYRDGKLFGSDGEVEGSPGLDGDSELKPTSFTKVFEGGRDKVAWTADLELDEKGNPYTGFSVQMDGESRRGKRYGHEEGCMDHRYWYARFDGTKWNAHEIAHAGTKLYANESDYTGLIALDPDDPNVVVISTNADPVSGKPLISNADKQRHWELFKGQTADGGATWKWTAITRNSNTDNLRPNIPSNLGGKRHILWGRGTLKSFTDYRLDMFVVSEERV